jgi:PAS domain S-box-containing protein
MDKQPSFVPEPDTFRVSSLLMAALESAPDCTVMLDPEGRILFANRSFRGLIFEETGNTVSAGMMLAPLLPENARLFFLEHWQQLALFPEEVISGEQMLTVRSGRRRWFEFRFAPVTWQNGKLRSVAIHLDEITERKEGELQLLQSERKFRHMLENAATPILVLDANGFVIFGNPEMEALFGKSFEELYNARLADLIPGFASIMETVAEKGGTLRFGEDKPLQSGIVGDKPVFVAGSLSSLTLDGERFYLAVLLNISSRVAFEAELQARNRRLRDIARMQSHDVRRPLANLLALVDLITDSEQLEEALLAVLKQETTALDNVIRSIVETSSGLD